MRWNMSVKSLNNLKKIFIYLVFYIALSALIIYFNLNRRYLIFNLGLTFIAYIFSALSMIKKNTFLTFITIIVTVIFFPNAIYMFTDFIHIKTSQYYQVNNGQVQYVMDYINWIKLALDTCMILLSLVLSFETFINILKTIKCYGYKFASFVMLLFFSIINGFAVYIGRFLRFNSWDIFKIHKIMLGLLNSLEMNDYYLIACFSFLQFFIILLFANLKSN